MARPVIDADVQHLDYFGKPIIRGGRILVPVSTAHDNTGALREVHVERFTPKMVVFRWNPHTTGTAYPNNVIVLD